MLSPLAFLPDDTKVSSLIDSNNGEWNESLISQNFSPEDTACILGIPLSEHKPRDRIIWAYTPKGKFTVNSAYKVAISMTQGNSDAEASHGKLQTRFWRQVWNLHIPNKIKLFTWRACKKSSLQKQISTTDMSWIPPRVMHATSTRKLLDTCSGTAT